MVNSDRTILLTEKSTPTNADGEKGEIRFDDNFLYICVDDKTWKKISLTILSGDNSSADTAYVPMVLYNTDETPPTASGFPIGTIYVQYTE